MWTSHERPSVVLPAMFSPPALMRCGDITCPVVSVVQSLRPRASKLSGAAWSLWVTPWQPPQLLTVGSCTSTYSGRRLP